MSAQISKSRVRYDQEEQSALSYWATGFACMGVMLMFCWLAGLKF